jgi:hypothetical protein
MMDYGKPTQAPILKMTVSRRSSLKEGHFGAAA